MSEPHLTRIDILIFIENAADAEESAKTIFHLERCTTCYEVFDELSRGMRAMEDGAVLEHLDDMDDPEFENDFRDGLRLLDDEAQRAEQDAAAADVLFVSLALQPVDKWRNIIAEHRESCSAAFVQRIIDAAAMELDRNPEHAVVLLQIAELVALVLDEVVSIRYRGHVWKQRSNAYRRLARYEDSIDAAIEAQNLYSSLDEPDSAFEVGQARLAMAVTLFKMTRYPATLKTLSAARSALEPFGESVPLAKVTMLDALVRIQQGEVVAAREILLELLAVEQRLGQHLEIGRVRMNLAECSLRLNELDAAIEDAAAAIDIFGSLGNVAELTRARWTVLMIRLARGETDVAEDLSSVADAYRALGMPGEAAFVGLDLAETLLRNEEWAEAELIARGLVSVFRASGVTLACVYALDYLQQAVQNREATAATVRYIREYITIGDPSKPFDPPRSQPN